MSATRSLRLAGFSLALGGLASTFASLAGLVPFDGVYVLAVTGGVAVLRAVRPGRVA